jgi:hypothetical protein
MLVRPTPWAYHGVPGEGSTTVPLPPPGALWPIMTVGGRTVKNPAALPGFLWGEFGESNRRGANGARRTDFSLRTHAERYCSRNYEPIMDFGQGRFESFSDNREKHRLLTRPNVYGH